MIVLASVFLSKPIFFFTFGHLESGFLQLFLKRNPASRASADHPAQCQVEIEDDDNMRDFTGFSTRNISMTSNLFPNGALEEAVTGSSLYVYNYRTKFGQICVLKE
ncbi:hypothetical protein ACJX0J_012045, partial [Zea mays]